MGAVGSTGEGAGRDMQRASGSKADAAELFTGRDRIQTTLDPCASLLKPEEYYLILVHRCSESRGKCHLLSKTRVKISILSFLNTPMPWSAAEVESAPPLV